MKRTNCASNTLPRKSVSTTSPTSRRTERLLRNWKEPSDPGTLGSDVWRRKAANRVRQQRRAPGLPMCQPRSRIGKKPINLHSHRPEGMIDPTRGEADGKTHLHNHGLSPLDRGQNNRLAKHLPNQRARRMSQCMTVLFWLPVPKETRIKGPLGKGLPVKKAGWRPSTQLLE